MTQRVTQRVTQRDSQPFVRVCNVWKVFGKDAKRVVAGVARTQTKEELLKTTGAVLALRDNSFSVNRGELFVIMGLSGSGKSTLIRTLLRLVEPTAGQIFVGDQEVTRLDREALRRYRCMTTSMVFQHYGLFPHYTVLQNAAYGLKARGDEPLQREERARRALATVGLVGWEGYYPHALSGGMQQRVGLARALATEPELLLMDEPFSGLDPLIRRQMQDELVEIQDRLQKTIIFVTHDLHEALKLGSRIAIMRHGEIIQIGTPEEIVTNPADDYVREFVRDASPAKVLHAEQIMEDPEVLLYSWEGPQTARTILARYRREWAFLVDKKRRYLGLISVQAIDSAERNRTAGSVLRARFETLADQSVPTATPSTAVEDLFPLAAASPYPIPILDEQGRLLGIVRNRAIIDSLTPTDTRAAEVADV